MTVSWLPVVVTDVVGAVLVLIISSWCALIAWHLIRERPENVFRNYLFLFTLAIVFFAVSRSVGHLVKQLLLLNNQAEAWAVIAPFSGAVNSTIFVVIFAFGIYFQRFQRVHSEIEYYRNNLEEMIEERTVELEKARHTLENILNNSNPISITGVNFELLRANEAYYALWPDRGEGVEPIRCYESRPGTHCGTDDCPLKRILAGEEFVSHEVSKTVQGKPREFIATSRPFRDVDGRLLGMVESFQDVTLLKLAEKALRESEERFRLIFAANPDPVILARLDDEAILDVNPAFVASTGISRKEALGRNSLDLGLWAQEGGREAFREALEADGEINNYEASFRVHGDQVRVGLASARILTVTDETCLLLVIRDITAEKEAEKALVEMDRMKSEFITTAAHELNTPLSAMLGYTEFLRTPEEFGGFSEEQKQDFLDEIYERGEALARIVNDLLDVSRIERGEPPPLLRREIDLVDLLRRKIRFFQAGEKGRAFRLELPDVPSHSQLQLDRHRINQVLDNLLTNAVKYSPPGREIVVEGREVAAGWEIRVIDQGIGMSPEQCERIFEKFYRGDAAQKAISGLGLGMSIVKHTVEAHGGTVRIESTLGEGTTVIFTLPFG